MPIDYGEEEPRPSPARKIIQEHTFTPGPKSPDGKDIVAITMTPHDVHLSGKIILRNADWKPWYSHYLANREELKQAPAHELSALCVEAPKTENGILTATFKIFGEKITIAQALEYLQKVGLVHSSMVGSDEVWRQTIRSVSTTHPSPGVPDQTASSRVAPRQPLHTHRKTPPAPEAVKWVSWMNMNSESPVIAVQFRTTIHDNIAPNGVITFTCRTEDQTQEAGEMLNCLNRENEARKSPWAFEKPMTQTSRRIIDGVENITRRYIIKFNANDGHHVTQKDIRDFLQEANIGVPDDWVPMDLPAPIIGEILQKY
jgi:hypothetical protein